MRTLTSDILVLVLVERESLDEGEMGEMAADMICRIPGAVAVAVAAVAVPVPIRGRQRYICASRIDVSPFGTFA
jgi:hypothetical protein